MEQQEQQAGSAPEQPATDEAEQLEPETPEQIHIEWAGYI